MISEMMLVESFCAGATIFVCTAEVLLYNCELNTEAVQSSSVKSVK